MNKFLEHLYIRPFPTTVDTVNQMRKTIKISTFSDHWKYDQTCPKYTKFRPFCDHCRYSKLHAEKVPISKEQILQTFVHKNLDFSRPLQVWQNMSTNTQI